MKRERENIFTFVIQNKHRNEKICGGTRKLKKVSEIKRAVQGQLKEGSVEGKGQ